MNFMKPKIFLPIIILSMASFFSCQSLRILKYNVPDVNDKYVFDNIEIQCNEKLCFLDSIDNINIDIPDCYNKKRYNNDFDSFLEDKKTFAFIMIKNDSILYERYFEGMNQDSILPSFSISKSFVSAMIGVAINENYINSVEDIVTQYIPKLKGSCFDKVTLEMLLNMHSGLKTDGFLDGVPRIYYSTNLENEIMKYYYSDDCTKIYNYQNINTLLLTMALENATGMNPAEYLEKKIWQLAGMSHDATWSVDSKEYNCVKGFCGINATPVDLAMFGRLYLKNGRFGNTQIIPEEWVKESLTINNDSKDDNGHFYSYHWRITKSGGFAALGLLGQCIYVYPPKEIVIVRMGGSLSNFDWIRFLEDVALSL